MTNRIIITALALVASACTPEAFVFVQRNPRHPEFVYVQYDSGACGYDKEGRAEKAMTDCRKNIAPDYKQKVGNKEADLIAESITSQCYEQQNAGQVVICIY